MLTAGIRVSPSKAEGADLSRPAEVPDPGEIIPEMVGDIISESWAASCRNDGQLPYGNSSFSQLIQVQTELTFIVI